MNDDVINGKDSTKIIPRVHSNLGKTTPCPLGPTYLVYWPWISPLTHRERRCILSPHMERRHTERHKTLYNRHTQRDIHIIGKKMPRNPNNASPSVPWSLMLHDTTGLQDYEFFLFGGIH